MSDKDTDALYHEIETERAANYLTCSVTQAFDDVWRCYSLRSQAVNYYRYGSRKDCAEKYDDLKYCMRTKTKSAKVADEMLRQRDGQKAVEKTNQRSSEDVWPTRA
ncbi:hypothetical protein DM01DRAFT_1373864 [Hesseltinella vesiculosa]|uniref:Uncharacterized protein n=1 Tax=Hesseltinella vesiculosa TaxID=101127 RepID=A0A1X2GI63_9FUNG|nr:hypothetical protein DM01DRAFT_1373864 [Hesseltinella vesiculosa]